MWWCSWLFRLPDTGFPRLTHTHLAWAHTHTERHHDTDLGSEGPLSRQYCSNSDVRDDWAESRKREREGSLKGLDRESERGSKTERVRERGSGGRGTTLFSLHFLLTFFSIPLRLTSAAPPQTPPPSLSLSVSLHFPLFLILSVSLRVLSHTQTHATFSHVWFLPLNQLRGILMFVCYAWHTET